MMQFNEFIEEFFQAIDEEIRMTGDQAEDIFVERMCEYLAENGIESDIKTSFWQKSSLGMKVNAYTCEDNRLALFVAVHEMPYNRVRSLSRTEAEKAFRRLVRFYEYASIRDLASSLEEAAGEILDLASLISDVAPDLDSLDLYVLTNSVYKSNEIIDLEVKGIDNVRFHVWDIERLYQLVEEQQGVETITIDFQKDIGNTFNVIKVPSPDTNNEIFDCYVGYIPGTILAKAYQQWGQRLIERNVRSFLQAKGTVNKGIRDTLQAQPELFVAYNNGISTTAEFGELIPLHEGENIFKVASLTGWQVVNGGQTTASLYHAWKSGVDIDNVNVQAKLTVLRSIDEEASRYLIARISQFANTQNKISFSDLEANDPFHVKLEHLSRTIWAPDPLGRKSNNRWYYERARGQYLVDLNRQSTQAQKNTFKQQNPKDQVITKTQIAKCFMSWECYPHIVGKGNEANFSFFMQYMRENKQRAIDADFFKDVIARVLIFNACEKIVKKMELPGYKANVVTYAVALASAFHGKEVDLETIWRNQEVTDTTHDLLEMATRLTWQFLSNPAEQGTNISQWCKKEECWSDLKAWYSSVTGLPEHTHHSTPYVDLPLTSARDGSIVPERSGINWGQREGRNPNQAYLVIPSKLHKEHPGFFPAEHEVFSVKTPEGNLFRCKVCQDGGKALETCDDNTLLGTYIREKLDVPYGERVSIDDLEQYGRKSVRLYKIADNEYLLDY